MGWPPATYVQLTGFPARVARMVMARCGGHAHKHALCRARYGQLATHVLISVVLHLCWSGWLAPRLSIAAAYYASNCLVVWRHGMEASAALHRTFLLGLLVLRGFVWAGYGMRGHCPYWLCCAVLCHVYTWVKCCRCYHVSVWVWSCLSARLWRVFWTCSRLAAWLVACQMHLGAGLRVVGSMAHAAWIATARVGSC